MSDENTMAEAPEQLKQPETLEQPKQPDTPEVGVKTTKTKVR